MKPERKPRKLVSPKVDPTKPAYLIVQKFGGLAKFCQICEWPMSTVHSWLTTGLIPSRKRDGNSYQSFIMERGASHGIEVLPRDFIEGMSVPDSPAPTGEGTAAPESCAPRDGAAVPHSDPING